MTVDDLARALFEDNCQAQWEMLRQRVVLDENSSAPGEYASWDNLPHNPKLVWVRFAEKVLDRIFNGVFKQTR